MYPCGTIYRDIEQGSPEWKLIRCGYATASRVSDVLSKGKGEAESIGRENYRCDLVVERLNGCPVEGFKNSYMTRGNEDEPNARLCYEFEKGCTVEQVAFIVHPTIEWFGISPDGLVGDDGMIEIKRKTPSLHLKYLFRDTIPSEYIPQMQAQMSCSGRLWNDYVSYCPELPENNQLFVKRLYRDDEYIALMEEKVKAFLQSVQDMVERLKSR